MTSKLYDYVWVIRMILIFQMLVFTYTDCRLLCPCGCCGASSSYFPPAYGLPPPALGRYPTAYKPRPPCALLPRRPPLPPRIPPLPRLGGLLSGLPNLVRAFVPPAAGTLNGILNAVIASSRPNYAGNYHPSPYLPPACSTCGYSRSSYYPPPCPCQYESGYY